MFREKYLLIIIIIYKMKNLLTLALLLGCPIFALENSVKLDDEHELKFVFEINRHGARGPMALPFDPAFGDGFQFGVDNLTPSGMRMRQVLG